VGRTPPGRRDLLEPELQSLICQAITQVEVPRSPPFCHHSASLHDLRTNFIAGAANAYTNVDYDICH
jgi:hypothetical protein